ncbi:MAG: hypothetical protein U5R06_19990 [candidate division KSB1 bacterium]|nr:hypothetical protein [candidate division KSB1 bacterium]
MRKKYDANPKSLMGRLWRWHINWCPGWKEYITFLPETEQQALAEQYNIKKYLHQSS